MAGYGIFWSIVESLYANDNEMPTQYDCIAYELHVDENTVKSIITDFGLFEVKESIFYSDSVARRLNERLEKSNKAKKSADERWGKYRLKLEENANAKQTQSKRKAKAIRPQSEGNAIKENNNITHTIYIQFEHLKLYTYEFNKLIEYGYSKEQIDFSIRAIQNYSNNKKYKSLYQTLQNWLSKDFPQVSALKKSKEEFKTKQESMKFEIPVNPYL